MKSKIEESIQSTPGKWHDGDGLRQVATAEGSADIGAHRELYAAAAAVVDAVARCKWVKFNSWKR